MSMSYEEGEYKGEWETSKHMLNAITTHQNTAAKNPNCNIAPILFQNR